MSTTQYKLYRKATFTLAKTIVIKMSNVGDAINRELDINGYPIIDHVARNSYPQIPIEAFYKYYQNLAGDYHISDNQRLYKETGNSFIQIQMASNDGIENVDFTKSLIQSDPVVANEYRYGSYYYNQLVEKYPDFEPLILGILYPVPLEVVIAARENEILYCGGYVKSRIGNQIGFTDANAATATGAIEPQETNVLSELQKWVDKYLFRWTNVDYGMVDDLYIAASLSVMYLQLPAAIMNIRLANIHTPYAHSFHIKQYLDSHGYLSHIVDYLPIQSVLWLYRNMRYYESNLGKQMTLQALVDHVFTPANIPIAGYDTTHNIGQMGTQLLPEPQMQRIPLNFDSIASSATVKSVEVVHDDCRDKARSNNKDFTHALKRIEDTIAYAGDDTLSSKILESEMLALPGRYPFTLTSVLMNMWLYLTETSDQVNKSLDGNVFVTNPLTGDRITMTMSNAYKVALYCFNKGLLGVELDSPSQIGEVYARCIPRSTTYLPTPEHSPKPSIAHLKGLTAHATLDQVTELYTKRTFDLHVNGASELNELGSDVFLEMVRQYNVYTRAEDLYARAELEYCQNQLYWGQIPCQITTPAPYSVWLDQIGVNLEGLNNTNLVDLAMELVTSCTGVDLTLSKTRAQAQQAALDVLKHFVSYTVLVLDKASFDKGHPTGVKSLRLSNMRMRYKKSLLGRMALRMDANLHAKQRFSVVYEEFGRSISFVSATKQVMTIPTPLPKPKLKVSNPTFNIRVPLSRVGPMNVTIDIPEYYSRDVPPSPRINASDLTYYRTDEYPNKNND